MSDLMWCPKCESDQYVKNGFLRGKQRYKCKRCGCQFTQAYKHGVARPKKLLALLLYLSGLSINRTAKIVGVSATSVVNWIRAFGKEFSMPQGYGEVVEVEIDEMWHYIQSKKTGSGSGALLNIKLTGCSDMWVVPDMNETSPS